MTAFTGLLLAGLTCVGALAPAAAQALTVGAAGRVPAAAQERTLGAAALAPPDLGFTVLSVSPVYAPGDGTSVVFAELRNDDPSTTLSVARAFAVTFYDSAGNAVGIVTGAAVAGAPAHLATGLRAVPPGQLGDVSATLPGVVAASARVTSAAASGSPFSDARLPMSSLPVRLPLSPGAERLAVTAVNTTGYPDRLHVVLAATAADGSILGIVAAPPAEPVPSGAAQEIDVRYQRLPGEPVADHYDVFIEGQADGVAATSLGTPSVGDAPIAGVPTAVATRLLDGHGRGLAGAQLMLVSRPPGGASSVLARTRTGTGGYASLTAVIPRTGVLQVVFAGDPTHAPIGTGDFAFRLTPRLSLAVTALSAVTVPPAGQATPPTAPPGVQGSPPSAPAAYVLHGSLPDYPGEKVAVQERSRAGWRTLRTVRADGHGGFRVTLRPARGRHTYRASVPATGGHLAAASAAVALRVQ